MQTIREVINSFFVIDSVWSLVFRGGIWFAISLVIIMSTDVANPQQSARTLKSNLGFFLLFIALSSGLMYLLFNFVLVPAAPVAG
jgi:hypothetical protein